MSNGKTVITLSLVRLRKNMHCIDIHYRKRVNIFLNQVSIVLEIHKLN